MGVEKRAAPAKREAGTSAERATAREAGKIFENRKQSALESWNLPPPPTRYTWTFFPVFWSSISPILALDFPPPLSSFSSFLSLFPILSAPPSAVLPPPPFSHPVIFYWTLKVKRSGISANLFSLTFFSLNELVSRGGRARAKKKTREVCSALKQR